MADYSDAYRSSCNYCGSWYGHSQECTSPQMTTARAIQAAKENGFTPAESRSGYFMPEKWKCNRGCGCVVWDMETHMKKVCTTFDTTST